MHIADIIASHILSHLPNRFQKRQPLNIPHRAAHLHHDNLHPRIRRQRRQMPLYLIGQMRHRLNRPPQKIPPPLLVNQRPIHLPRRNIRRPRQLHINKPFVMPQIQVRLPPVPGYEHLPMLIRRHRTRIHIQIRIQLHHRNRQPPAFENAPNRSNANPLADGTDHPPGNEYILGGHTFPPKSNGALRKASNSGCSRKLCGVDLKRRRPMPCG